jgi:serine/threonine kinase 16
MALPPQLYRALENVKEQAKDALWALSSCICHQAAKVKINGRTCQFCLTFDVTKSDRISTVKIIKVLGEGGFSFVYLVQDEASGVGHRLTLVFHWHSFSNTLQRQFALKKIRCPTGAEGVAIAMREVEAYRRFK